MIRTEAQFVWNFTALTVFLAVGLLFGMLIHLVPAGGFLGSLAGVFIHVGPGHLLNNIWILLTIGLGLSTFAHPVEFVGILLSATVVDAIVSQFVINVVGLSLVLYAAVAALIVYLFGTIFELKRFGAVEKLSLAVTAVLLLLTVLFLVSDQLLHDFAVVFAGQDVQIDRRGYTRVSSVAHVVGFLWGLAAAVGLRGLRYQVLDIE